MQTMRDKWTDERLDDLNVKVDRGFDRLDAEMRAFRMEMQAFRAEMQGIRTEMQALRVEMKEGFDAVNARIDAQNRTMLWFAGALIVAIVASNLGILAAILAS